MATSRSSSDPQLFHCPTCGAALPAPGDVASVRCEYCNSNVLVPAEFRKAKEPDRSQFNQPVVINLGGAAESPYPQAPATVRGGLAKFIIFMVLLCLVFSVGGGILAASGVWSAASLFNQTVRQVVTEAVVTLPVQNEIQTQMAQFLPTTAPTGAPFYTTLLQFGAKGVGPGQFDDSRWLAVAPDGGIFTAEFQDGRLQKFDPSGKFQALVTLPPDDQEYTTVSDIAADYAGRIYVARRGDILIFNAADGAQVGTIPGSFPDTWFETVVVDPSNMLYAFHVSAGELDLIKMDANGNEQFRKVQVTEGLVKKTEISDVRQMAVDGLGNLYMLDTYQNQVYKFDSQANFIDRFGSEGDGPGLLDNPENLAVDGQGRIYILDGDGIELFDNNGVGLKQIPDFYDGYAFDITLDPQGNIYIITNAPQVYKISMDWGP